MSIFFQKSYFFLFLTIPFIPFVVKPLLHLIIYR